MFDTKLHLQKLCNSTLINIDRYWSKIVSTNNKNLQELHTLISNDFLELESNMDKLNKIVINMINKENVILYNNFANKAGISPKETSSIHKEAITLNEKNELLKKIELYSGLTIVAIALPFTLTTCYILADVIHNQSRIINRIKSYGFWPLFLDYISVLISVINNFRII